MQTRVHEIADGVYRLSTFVPEITPEGFTFNQFLLDAEEPLLFHCGHRRMFPLISAAVARVMPLERLRWISFGHYEADECGAMNEWLAASPGAQVAHGELACDVSLNDMADRPPRALADGELIDLGGKRVRFLHTPHVPHGWDAGVMFEETQGLLLCGDLFTHGGDGPAIAETEVLSPGVAAEDMFHAMCMGPDTGRTLHRLADLQPRTLALMHGSSFAGDGALQLRGLADHYAGRVAALA